MKYQISFMGWKIYILTDRSYGWYMAKRKGKYIWGDSLGEIKQKIAKIKSG